MASRRLPSEPWMRPTTNKVREALVSSLQMRLPQARVLDLFAGTGSLGLACFKAGCGRVVFIESDRRSLKYLIDEATKAGAKEPACRIIHGKLPLALSRLEEQFDIILADPPYNSEDGPQTLALLTEYLAPEGIIVFEHHHKENYPAEINGLKLEKCKRYGETALSFWIKDTSVSCMS
ncbi:RsmD family RNA methyltransferase [bacterium]|nr:RsmD family RNA methyltransferase [bacterium]